MEELARLRTLVSSPCSADIVFTAPSALDGSDSVPTSSQRDRVGLEPILDYDSKERGYQITEATGILGLYLSCNACKHTVAMLWADVVKTWGVGTWTRDIARSLKCSVCGARRGSIMAWSDHRPASQRDQKPPACGYPMVGPLVGQKRWRI